MEMRYLLDTSAICDSLRFYPQGAFPSFWDKFTRLIESNNCYSVDEVMIELQRWFEYNEKIIETHPMYIIKSKEDFFIKPSDKIILFFRNNLEGIYGTQEYTQNRKPHADPLLIAEAGVNEYFLITSERLKGKSIPAVCERLKLKGIKIECGGLNTLIEREGWIF